MGTMAQRWAARSRRATPEPPSSSDMTAPGKYSYANPEPDIVAAIRDGAFVDMRPHPYGSNAVFTGLIEAEAGQVRVIYKPQRGEAPLWDFPPGTLYSRECAAFELNRALGWDMVPFTIARDGPYGIGAVQIFVEHNPAETYFTLRNEHRTDLQQMALFDALANNADRKGSHCLRDESGRLWGIDHGLMFNEDYKLRTVIWDFEGEPIPDDMLGDLQDLRPRLEDGSDCAVMMSEFLLTDEVEALRDRLDVLLEERIFPVAGLGRNVPWPPL